MVPLADRYHIPQAVARLDDPDAALLVRDHAEAPSVAVPRSAWRFHDATSVALDGGFAPGRIYECYYRAEDPPVVGLGFTAVRDTADFLRWARAEAGNPCAGTIDRSYVFGVSQSGRFLRHLLYLGLDEDEAGRFVWDAVVPQFPGHRTLRYDKRGHGLSGSEGGDSIEAHAADLAALLDARGIRRATIVGLSIGGMIALGLTRLRPDLTDRLILCDTAHRIGTAEAWQARIAAVEANGVAGIAGATMERWFSARFRARQPELDRSIASWIGRMGLSDWLDKRVDALSKGMSQKVQFIASVLNKPDLLILDEPFSGLDPVNAEVLKDAVLDLKKAGTTVVFSTHDMGVAERLCDRIFMIYKGRKVLDGTLGEIQSIYGFDTVRVESDAGVGAFAGIAGVDEINDQGNVQEVRFRGDPQDLLRALVDRTRITRFEIARPSLHDIFVRIARPEATILEEEAVIHAS